MPRNHDLSLVQMVCTSGLDVMTSMPLLSDVIKRLVPSFSLSMIRVDESCAPHEHYSEYFDDFSHRLFAGEGGVFAARTEDPAAFNNLLRNPNPVGTLIDTSPAYVAGATYQHLFKRNGIHHCLDVAIRDGSGPLGILGIFREESARGFTRSDVATVRGFYEHLVHAFARKPWSSDFDEVDSAMMIVDPEGTICWTSPSARVWLEDATGGGERVALMDRHALPEACRIICSQVAAGRRAEAARKAAHVPTFVLPVAGGRLRLRGYSLEPPGTTRRAGEYVGIQLVLEMSKQLRVFRALDREDLSPQLRRMAMALWKRRSASEVSAALGIRPGTLKSYGKELYARLEVSSAEELAQVLDAQASAVTFDLRRHLPRSRME